jgi:hypothetical protein
MACTEQMRLLTEEKNAWAAYHSLRDSGSADQEERDSLRDSASDASTRLRQHIYPLQGVPERLKGRITQAADKLPSWTETVSAPNTVKPC